ncbi:YesK family protein [Bacillus sp. NPDC093026]|uniref:YesK family protein n=1 Tax=Bacillus sp. NPDC093026 TaxID=3363948 RepID=UPI003809F16F
MSFWLMTAILAVIILGGSLIFKKKKSPIQYGFPAIFIMVSLILFMISFFVGEWEGMGLSAISVSLLIASVIALMMTSILSYFSGESQR